MLGAIVSSSTTNASSDVSEAGQQWVVLWKFVIHEVLGALIFSVIAVPAIGLDLGVQQVETLHISSVIINGLKIAEYAIFGADLSLFITFLAKDAFRTAKRL